ncbi:MAG: hypothetical protein UW68_C0037G0003 [Candidatus Collierbacteria bacterium GW2011_GWB1_44_6]|uniref:Uncharacterized protein n=1 Tax=Candidatus Collierbacteria bacterium GW2011_GWB1_44_6 TaxID=1618384 RepID=A0A0G1JLL4_9BACT|nr:MAG: hypothetical protein UW68_C0037G0003 [Candidatus Collierbacteria bacterium GW2011_GWB1_44_6]KKT82080.1 MAG: hypothetical protein UW80_C0042G0001 [Microgenomates group bacterium GW2011_GWC1_44_9]
MSAPVVVSDLEFVAKSSLFCVDEFSQNGVAYFSGMVAGLNIARAYSQLNVTDPDPRFWTLLQGSEYPVPALLDFVARLSRYTTPRFNFVLSWFPESGLRYGRPGLYYSMGISDATSVAIKQVPVLYRYLKEDHWEYYTLAWIDQKIRWAKFQIQVEKAKLG